ncbi:hypothetical protein HUG17_8424 [Dermatophagoides farinae]|uniref:Uncharacterized protein n=1 Tax=Dermatophagoides farinae TaxID=6954 RepID=A0A9D4P0R6_DERFA|nr:hypothetical protein HUG17_8424 [Dermatophagoides farinae]
MKESSLLMFNRSNNFDLKHNSHSHNNNENNHQLKEDSNRFIGSLSDTKIQQNQHDTINVQNGHEYFHNNDNVDDDDNNIVQEINIEKLSKITNHIISQNIVHHHHQRQRWH